MQCSEALLVVMTMSSLSFVTGHGSKGFQHQNSREADSEVLDYMIAVLELIPNEFIDDEFRMRVLMNQDHLTVDMVLQHSAHMLTPEYEDQETEETTDDDTLGNDDTYIIPHWDWRCLCQQPAICFDPNVIPLVLHRPHQLPWCWVSLSLNHSSRVWDLVAAHPDMNWNWMLLSNRADVTWEFVLETHANRSYRWNWFLLSERADLSWSFVEAHVDDLPWDWTSLSNRVGKTDSPYNPSYSFFMKRLHWPWVWNTISRILPWNLIVPMNDEDGDDDAMSSPPISHSLLNWYILSGRKDLSWEDTVRCHPDLPWDWLLLSSRWDIPWCKMPEIAGLPWNWVAISSTVPWTVAVKHPYLPWDWQGVLSTRRDIPWTFVFDHRDDIPWNWKEGLSHRSDLTWSIISSAPDHPWNWHHLICRSDLSIEAASWLWPLMGSRWPMDDIVAIARDMPFYSLHFLPALFSTSFRNSLEFQKRDVLETLDAISCPRPHDVETHSIAQIIMPWDFILSKPHRWWNWQFMSQFTSLPTSVMCRLLEMDRYACNNDDDSVEDRDAFSFKGVEWDWTMCSMHVDWKVIEHMMGRQISSFDARIYGGKNSTKDRILPWDWSILSTRLDLPMHLLASHVMDWPWEWTSISARNDVPMYILLIYLAHEQEEKGPSSSSSSSPSFSSHIDFDVMSCRGELTWFIVTMLPHAAWNIHEVCNRLGLPPPDRGDLEFRFKNATSLARFWKHESTRASWLTIAKHPLDLPWDWSYLSSSPHLGWDVVESHAHDWPWDWSVLSNRLDVPCHLIKSHAHDWHWDWDRLSVNHTVISQSMVSDNPEFPWDWWTLLKVNSGGLSVLWDAFMKMREEGGRRWTSSMMMKNKIHNKNKTRVGRRSRRSRRKTMGVSVRRGGDDSIDDDDMFRVHRFDASIAALPSSSPSARGDDSFVPNFMHRYYLLPRLIPLVILRDISERHVRRNECAKIIQRHWRLAISTPSYLACQRRLLHYEIEEMADEGLLLSDGEVGR